MSQKILVVDPINHCTYRIDDPRAARDLRQMVYAGGSLVGVAEIWRAARAQPWASGLEEARVLVVVLGDPPVLLSSRHYGVLIGMAQGLKTDQIARRLNISRRTVYEYISDLKDRFNVQTREEVLVQAAQRGMLDPLTSGEDGVSQSAGQD